jgi:hypothetical protein
MRPCSPSRIRGTRRREGVRPPEFRNSRPDAERRERSPKVRSAASQDPCHRSSGNGRFAARHVLNTGSRSRRRTRRGHPDQPSRGASRAGHPPNWHPERPVFESLSCGVHHYGGMRSVREFFSDSGSRSRTGGMCAVLARVSAAGGAGVGHDQRSQGRLWNRSTWSLSPRRSPVSIS